MKKRVLHSLQLNKKSISNLLGGKDAPSDVSIFVKCNTGCNSPVNTCGIINCNLSSGCNDS